MIFVTVGTHEQQFNRLIEYIDRLRENGEITEEVVVQRGFSDYEPSHCIWNDFFSYNEMQKKMDEARIVITHGGPSSFMAALQAGKNPIVIPRRKEFGEHVNNHQVDFCRLVAERYRNIIVVEEINELKVSIFNYQEIVRTMAAGLESNNAKFCRELDRIVNNLM